MKKHIRTLLLLSLLVLVNTAVVAQGAYTVQPGDSLFLLASRYNTSINAIKTGNNLGSDTIYVNQTLDIPVNSLATASYTVKSGDSLYHLARRFDTTVQELKLANRLLSDVIVVGQRLTVPGQNNLLDQRASLNTSERDILARIVHAEAQGEPYSGKVAVAAVIFNRVDSPDFPNTVHGVIYQPWQFEPVLNGWMDKPADKEAYRAVDDALTGQDPAHGAVLFYNPVKAPNAWMATRPVVTRIGNHVFMR